LLQQGVLSIRSDNQHVRRRSIECRDEQDNDALAVNLPESLVNNIADVEEMLRLVAETSLWSSIDNPGGFDTVEAFRDINDMAMVARRDNKCFVVFRATNAFNPLDTFQLFDWSKKEIGNCKVRGGIYKAYYSCYVDKFVAAVDECMMHGDDAELYITGHSQGKQLNCSLATGGRIA
jgi:Lipase (class 3)